MSAVVAPARRWHLADVAVAAALLLVAGLLVTGVAAMVYLFWSLLVRA